MKCFRCGVDSRLELQMEAENGDKFKFSACSDHWHTMTEEINVRGIDEFIARYRPRAAEDLLVIVQEMLIDAMDYEGEDLLQGLIEIQDMIEAWKIRKQPEHIGGSETHECADCGSRLLEEKRIQGKATYRKCLTCDSTFIKAII
jgi:DNA-directed RNA polymerase subunit RPC12/RpoP